jgi:hypothetical protein
VDYDPWVSLVTGNITTNTTWNASSTYVIDGEVTVDAGVTLTIKKGVVVKFKTAASGLVVNGGLDAQGGTSDTHRIHFTSYKDDTVGGDTNGDSGATSPAAGDWNGILINDGASTILRYGSIRYGGYTDTGSGGRSTQLYNDGGDITIQNMEVATGTTYGIYQAFEAIGFTSLHVWGCDIHGQTYGVYVDDHDNVWINSNNIHGNSSYGVWDDTVFGIDAQYNYWGASDGPSGDGPGSGDAVHDADYSNWLNKVHFLFVENGQIIRATSDGNIRWDWYGGTPSAYTTAWYGAMSKWNSLGTTTIATSTGTTHLEIQDVTTGADSFVGVYNPNYSPDRLQLNTYWMGHSSFTDTMKQYSVMHELGHAFGLEHSYSGNIMNSYVDSTVATTTFGAQDLSDYDYLY